ncbi:MAG: zinc ribbon domain-containing protein [Nevskiaceae bacterium]|jgi:putative FmdB family regulatory protein|nr:zinc ribbon domain-containing protein [Nevskiaceae bacterium]
MPIYDFQCAQCGKRFEALVRVDHSAECPACKATDVKRLFSSLAAISTQKTRSVSHGQARAKGMAIKKEKDHAHAEYMRNHIRDHHS